MGLVDCPSPTEKTINICILSVSVASLGQDREEEAGSQELGSDPHFVTESVYDPGQLLYLTTLCLSFLIHSYT